MLPFPEWKARQKRSHEVHSWLRFISKIFNIFSNLLKTNKQKKAYLKLIFSKMNGIYYLFLGDKK